ncbi:uncharacterized protein LOC112685295 [Sipha flava]|uniref:Uncharacterized protein LOC112685295 n=1 Tax=Sipha flava TaxID=143950 RepID=A0A8B8FQZ4_9HEMI|nr:uncharacterized protein LOC112685295 [Sipha flava]
MYSKINKLLLSDNVVHEVPAGLPKSLVHLNLNKNPIKSMDQLSRAVGLQVLSRCGLAMYPALDVSGNELLNDLDPVALVATCRLYWLNVIGCTALFRLLESRCRCLSAVQWTRNHKILMFGMPPCPVANGTSVTDKCTAPTALHQAMTLFERCTDEWDRRNTYHRSIGLWLVITVVEVTVPMYVRWRNCRDAISKAGSDMHSDE